METPELFPLPEEGAEIQACDRCLATETCSYDGLRVRGWTVFNGESVTGKKLKVRLCPACQRKA